MSLRQIRIKSGRLTPDERKYVYGASQLSLWKPEGAPARDFLAKRSLDVDTIAAFRIGYVPGDVNHHFAERVVMPIFDSCDNLLALSVRPIVDDPAILKEYCKYWNESYSKGEHLYGLNRAKLSILKSGFAILCEGQMDVIAMHSYGITNAVGVLGGAFTTIQAMLLKRWTDQIVIMFDGDKAGHEHAARCQEVLNAYGFRFGPYAGKGKCLKAATVDLNLASEGKDPNECLKRAGSLSMRLRIQTAMKAVDMKCPEDWVS